MSGHGHYLDVLVRSLGTPDGLRAAGQFIRDAGIGLGLLSMAISKKPSLEEAMLIVAFALTKAGARS